MRTHKNKLVRRSALQLGMMGGAVALALGGGPGEAVAAKVCTPDTLPVTPLPPEQRGVPVSKLPIELEADQIERTQDGPVVFTGRAVAKRGAQSLTADRLVYTEAKDEVEAKGSVLLRTAAGDAIHTSFLRYRLDNGIGEARRSEFEIADRERDLGDPKRVAVMARGSAERVKFASQDLIKLDNATYTTCVKGQDDVILQAKKVELDFVSGEGTAKNMTLRFKNVPIFYAPTLTFPISNKRKSGFLYPSLGGQGGSGFVFGVPYYWNIAPNMDATITPWVMTRRGIKLDGEFRYLQENYSGTARGAYLPSDNEYRGGGEDRGAFSWKHRQRISKRWRGDVDYQWVSDADYFDDFSTDIGITAQTHLPQQANVYYDSPWGEFSAGILRYQTIDDTIPKSSRPHERLPRLTFKADIPYRRGGPKYEFRGEVVNFDHDVLVSGTRLDLTPSVSFPMEAIYGYLTPKLAVRHTSYHGLDNVAAGADTNPSRTVGVFSVDSGLFFERNASWRGAPYIQTLEPRVFYVYANREKQDDLPNFDTGAVSFNNFSDFFRDNQFTGADRVEDANRVTVAVTSRMLDAKTGKERMRASVGQIYFFEDREVTFGKPLTRSTSDILFDLQAQLTPVLEVGGFWQWNPSDDRTEQARVTVNYSNGGDRRAYVTYRYTRNATDQAEVGGRWPLAPRWSVQGRYVYSFRDDQSLETYAGVNYNACCWVLHIAAQRRVNNTTNYRNAILIQLQLTGLAKITTGF